MHVLEVFFTSTFLLFLYFGLLIQWSIFLRGTKLSDDKTFLTIVRLRCLRWDFHGDLFFFYFFSDCLSFTIYHTWSFFHLSFAFLPFFMQSIGLVVKLLSYKFLTSFHFLFLTSFGFNFLLFSFQIEFLFREGLSEEFELILQLIEVFSEISLKLLFV